MRIMKKSKIILYALAFSSFFLLSIFVVHRSHADEYRIGEGDLLKITVYDHPDLTTDARVSGEGKISFPLVGEVDVTGLTSAEVEKRLAKLLDTDYIMKPQVAVFIVEYKSKKVTVLGEFIKPGLVELRGNSTLLEVISGAGGITTNAGDMLFIQRKIFRGGSNENEDITVTVDLKRLLEEGDIKANVSVQDGDSIYVPKAAFVYVSGEVKTPGAYKITKGLTVLKAITIAGGFTTKAWQGRTKIIRKSSKIDKGDKAVEKGEKPASDEKVEPTEVTIPASMDALVMEDDVIVVPESFF